MKNKKILLSIAILIATIILAIIPTTTKAATPATSTAPLYFGIKEYREGEGIVPNNLAYALHDPNANNETSDSGAKIWQILKYPSLASNAMGDEGNYYCIRAGFGFSDGSNMRAEYNISYDLKEQKEQARNSGNIVLKNVIESEYFNNLLALTDIMYLKGVSTSEEKAKLLSDAGIYPEDYTYQITDSDIEAVQQAAIWYFTNHDEEPQFTNIYNNYNDPNDTSGTRNTSWLFYKTYEMEGYTSLGDYDLQFDGNGEQTGPGKDRQAQAVDLYDYLITKANELAALYANGTAKPKTRVTVYSHTTKQATQPLIVIEKLPEPEFDLSLRKYITKVDGVAVTQSRVPNIDTATLVTGTTATYKHKKDPVVVKTGSIVTYNIAIYNEGEKDGRATEIIDQLPTGLKFLKLSDTSKTKFTATYSETTNKVTITRNTSNTENLEAYKAGENLKSEVIELEVEVTAKADSSKEKILTNIAWISKEYDAEDDITIIEQEGKDRDSTPGNAPTETANNLATTTGKGYLGNTSNTNKNWTSSESYFEGQQDDDDFEKVKLEPQVFDLKLVKRIIEVNGIRVPERIKSIDITNLANKTATTATYKLEKEPVAVKKGDIVKYEFRIYNEGDIDGYASEITENIPDGLEVIGLDVLKTDEEIDADTTLSEVEKEAIKQNQKYGWLIAETDTATSKATKIKTDYLAKGRGAEIATENANLIKAFDATKPLSINNPDHREVSVYLRVISEEQRGTIIRNEAAITEDTDSKGDPVDDRDSHTDQWNKEDDNKFYDDERKWPVYKEDDEDYDNLKLQSFDLALRKFIATVNADATTAENNFNAVKTANGKFERAPIVDTSKLNTVDENGKLITTATYNHTKEPVEVNRNDYVIYLMRVYNECDLDGYASQIKDHLPEQLEYVKNDFNEKIYGWSVSDDGRTVTTNYLDNKKIEKISEDDEGKIIISYQEVPIMCRVKSTAKTSEKITNIADITIYKDENKNIIIDRDSQINNVELPKDSELPSYKDDETGSYIPGQQDDDDFEKVIIKKFDLALRKFITDISNKAVTTRIPQVKYNKENNKITYEHSKEPLDVVTNDIVTYTIRVYNEGEINGFASEVSDDLPKGLEFLPENELNKEYRWVMYDAKGEKTDDVTKAVKVTTDYLSKEQGEARMAADNSSKENPALLKAFDTESEISDTNPDYADVKIAFKVVESNESDRIIINEAQISDDTDEHGNPVDDEDSTPDKWIEGEDDQDIEKVKLTYFDLALRKWVTHAIVIENGKETITETGHKAEDDPEQPVKVEIHRKKLSAVTVKFKYSIRITNEGDIAGYAKEITDYIPAGLKFDAKDNPGWTDEGNNVISTRLLENKLLQPGESAEVQVTLTWINGNNNLGLKVNVAEISEDYNDKNVPDRDSTPDNKVEGEDDQDDAPVLLAVSTGQARIYFGLGFIILVTIASGVVLIKKFVL